MEDFLVHHFNGTFPVSTRLTEKTYDIIGREKDDLTSFNENSTLIYSISMGYEYWSKEFIGYIERNDVSSVNICDDLEIHIRNIEKITRMKRVFDERYDSLNDWILYADAGDCVLNLGMGFDEMKRRFDTYGCKVLFACEDNDFPYSFRKKWKPGTCYRYREDYFKEENPENLYPTGEKRFINSGIYMGRKEDVRTLIDRCISFLDNHKEKDYESDQFVFKKVAGMMNGDGRFVDVDHRNLLFRCGRDFGDIRYDELKKQYFPEMCDDI